MNVTASLVLYRNDPAIYEDAIRSVIESDVAVRLSVVDNSPEPLVCTLFEDPRVIYRHAGANIGFGAAHNLAFEAVAATSDLHVIVNPDVRFDPSVIGTLAAVFTAHPDVMAAMPTIEDDNGQRQHLCKALPNPLQLIGRRFIPLASMRDALDAAYEFRRLPAHGLVDIPNLSGCFLAVRANAFVRICGFDARYFMYMEDIDLVRRLGDLGRTVYVPAARVRHGHARDSYRLGKLMIIHIRSALRYFSKWGWLDDPVRRARNHAARRALDGS